MALLACDSFDHYTTSTQQNLKAVRVGGSLIQAGTGRRGTSALVGAQGYPIPDSASVIVGAAFKFLTIGSVSTIIELKDGVTVQMLVRLNASGRLEVVRSTTPILAIGTTVLSAGVFYFIEFKCTIANSIAADSCIVRINGVDEITLAAATDTQATANAFTNRVDVQSSSVLDDVYICDNSGSSNNDFLGDVRVDCLLPNGAGNYTQFTPSAGSNFQNVDETTPDDDTTYNQSATAAQKDSYAMSDLSSLTSEDIKGLQVVVMAKKTDAGDRALKIGVRSNTTDSVDAGTALSTDYTMMQDRFDVDPATGVAWTKSGVDAVQAMVEVA